MNAANRKPPTAVTAATSPAARTNGRPSVVTGPGVGQPGGQRRASDSDSVPDACGDEALDRRDRRQHRPHPRCHGSSRRKPRFGRGLGLAA